MQIVDLAEISLLWHQKQAFSSNVDIFILLVDAVSSKTRKTWKILI